MSLTGPTTRVALRPATDPATMVGRRILGIDPGLRSTGYGVVTQTERGLSYLASGCIKSPPSGGLPTRLKTILVDLAEVIAMFQPTEVAIEIVFVNVNPQSTLLLGQARGAAISAAVLADLPVAEYTALQIKQAVAGHGKAAKEQVQEMVRRLLVLPSVPGADASDALACAICHAHASASLGGLRRSGYRVRNGRIV